MKKKGHPTIPDFSRTKVGSPPGPPREQKAAAPRATLARTIKPQATSAKSGRRGQ
jgi:hypothetical protein